MNHLDDAIPVDPRLDGALRRTLQSGDLTSDQHETIRRRLGIPGVQPGASMDHRRAVIPDATSLSRRVPIDSEVPPMLRQEHRGIARQWLEIAAAVLLFAVVGAILVTVFRGSDDGSQPAASPPMATRTAEPGVTPTQATETATEYALADTWDMPDIVVSSVTIGADGELYLMDSRRDVVTILNPDGSEAGTIEFAPGLPTGSRNDVAVGPDEFVYVLDADGRTVKKIDPDGRIIDEWGGNVSQEPGSFFDASAIAVGDDGRVYVSVAGLQVLTDDGQFVEEWTDAGGYLFPEVVTDLEFANETLYVLAQNYRGQSAIVRLDREGNLAGDALFFGEPQFGDDGVVLDVDVATALAVDTRGNMFVADPFDRAIIKLNSHGDVVTRWDIAGDPERSGDYLEVAVADDGRVYVADGFRNVIDVFVPADAVPPQATVAMGEVDPALLGTVWELVSLDGNRPPEGATVTLRFEAVESGWISGEVVCNSYSLKLVTANQGRIVFGEGGGITDEGCVTDSLTLEQYNDLANRYMDTMMDVSRYDQTGNQLRLITNDGRELVFTSASRGVADTPDQQTTEEQQAIIEQERQALMPFPVPEDCLVTPGWEGPEFRVGRSESYAYFIDGDGLTMGTTHGVLFEGENNIGWLAEGEISTEEALRGPGTLVARRTDVGAGEPVEIPIEVNEQISSRIVTQEGIERAWATTVTFPEPGCWRIHADVGSHNLNAVVYVYPSETGEARPTTANTFPHPEGVRLLDAAPADVEVAASNATVALYAIETTSNTMEFLTYYQTALAIEPTALEEAGWMTVDNRGSQYVPTATLINEEERKVAVNIVLAGRVIHEYPQVLEDVELSPFEIDPAGIDTDEVLIHTLVFSCEEAEMADCIGPVLPDIDPFQQY